MDPTKNGGTLRIFIGGGWIELKNGGTFRIFIGGDWIQLKTVVLSEYLLDGTGSN